MFNKKNEGVDAVDDEQIEDEIDFEEIKKEADKAEKDNVKIEKQIANLRKKQIANVEKISRGMFGLKNASLADCVNKFHDGIKGTKVEEEGEGTEETEED